MPRFTAVNVVRVAARSTAVHIALLRLSQYCRPYAVTAVTCRSHGTTCTVFLPAVLLGLKSRHAARMQLNVDAELSFLTTRHVVKWRPTAAIIYRQMSIWNVRY